MQKKKLYFLYSKSILLYAVVLSALFLFVLNAKGCMSAVREALIMCAQTVIPSLFPFFVFSGLLIQSGFIPVAGAVITPVIHPLFRVSGSGALAFVIGIVSGYPMGAKMTADLYREKLISRTEGHKLLPFCNNSGPLFIIGAVGGGMLGNVRIGFFLYMVHLAAALMVACCFRFYGESAQRGSASVRSAVGSSLREHYRQQRGGSAVSECVRSAVNTILLICGFIVFFSAFTECLKPLLALVRNDTARLLLSGMLEVTAGVNRVCSAQSALPQKLVMISALLGFGGICVHLQVLGMLSGTDLKMKTYLVGKLLHAMFSAFLCMASLRFLPSEVITVWNPTFSAPEASLISPISVLSALAVAVSSGYFALRRKVRRKK